MISDPDEIEILDKFAIAAMNAILTQYREECAILNLDTGLTSYDGEYCESVAIASYNMAEKMLLERRVILYCSKEEVCEKGRS